MEVSLRSLGDGVVDVSHLVDFYRGIYFFVEDGEVTYIGQAKNIAKRLWAHCMPACFDEPVKCFDRVFCLPCSPDEMDIAETALILAFRPRRNGAPKKAKDPARGVYYHNFKVKAWASDIKEWINRHLPELKVDLSC